MSQQAECMGKRLLQIEENTSGRSIHCYVRIGPIALLGVRLQPEPLLRSVNFKNTDSAKKMIVRCRRCTFPDGTIEPNRDCDLNGGMAGNPQCRNS